MDWSTFNLIPILLKMFARYKNQPEIQAIYKAHVSALMMCRRLHSVAVRYCLPSILNPLLTCQSIASFLKVLKLREWGDYEEVLDVCKVLGSLTSLQEFHLIRGSELYDKEERSPPELPLDTWIEVLSHYLKPFELSSSTPSMNEN